MTARTAYERRPFVRSRYVREAVGDFLGALIGGLCWTPILLVLALWLVSEWRWL